MPLTDLYTPYHQQALAGVHSALGSLADQFQLKAERKRLEDEARRREAAQYLNTLILANKDNPQRVQAIIEANRQSFGGVNLPQFAKTPQELEADTAAEQRRRDIEGIGAPKTPPPSSPSDAWSMTGAGMNLTPVNPIEQSLSRARAYAALFGNQPMPREQFESASTFDVQGPSGYLEANRIANAQQEKAHEKAVREQQEKQFQQTYSGIDLPKSQAEIRAENALADERNSGRKLAMAGQFIPLTDQYGTVIGAWNPKTGTYANPPVEARKSAIPNAERETAATAEGMMQDLAQTKKLAARHKNVIGPVSGRTTALRSKFENVDPEVNELQQLLGSMRNRLLYLKSGKQINESEYQRLADTMPDMNQPSSKFFTNLVRMETEMKQVVARNAALQRTGGGRRLDNATALQFLEQAGGDREKARELARAAGYSF